jgi:hypothetical protein
MFRPVTLTTSAGTLGPSGAWALAQHPHRACNQYRYVVDVKHNTAVWVLVWLFVAALVLALINAAVLTKLN